MAVRRWSRLTQLFYVEPGEYWDGWLPVGGRTILVCHQPSTSTQPGRTSADWRNKYLSTCESLEVNRHSARCINSVFVVSQLTAKSLYHNCDSTTVWLWYFVKTLVSHKLKSEVRRYHEAFDYDGSDRNYDLHSTAIRLRHDYDEKLTCSFFARVESRWLEEGARDTS